MYVVYNHQLCFSLKYDNVDLWQLAVKHNSIDAMEKKIKCETRSEKETLQYERKLETRKK